MPAGAAVPDPWRHTSLERALAAPEPRTLPEDYTRRFVATDEVVHTYLRGRFHTEVLLRGAECRQCGEKLDRMGTRGPMGTSRDRPFPFKATLKQVRRGATHRNRRGGAECGGRLDFDLQLLSQNDQNQYNEPGPVLRFRPDMEGQE